MRKIRLINNTITIINDFFYFRCTLGSGLSCKDPRAHEKKLVEWLDKEKKMRKQLLLGDMFDFWFEYRTVVLKVSCVFGKTE
jgi:hypothetical protein